jgi:hypothetical protein
MWKTSDVNRSSDEYFEFMDTLLCGEERRVEKNIHTPLKTKMQFHVLFVLQNPTAGDE